MPSTALDSLYGEVARKVLNESLAVKKGQTVLVETWNTGLPFAKHVVMEARRKGAIPLTLFEDEDAYVDGAKETPKDVLGKMGKHEFALLSKSDAYVFIPGPELGTFAHRMERSNYLDSIRYNDAWYDAAAKAKLKGVRLTFGYVGELATKVLGKPVESIVTHQLRAALVDLREVRVKGKEVAGYLAEGAKAKVQTGRSTLTMTIKGGLEVQDGTVDAADVSSLNNVAYVPPGFVYVDLAPESVSGTFHFSQTLTRFGLISDGSITFEGGEVVEAKSPGSRSLLKKLTESASSKNATGAYVGLNPLLKYGYGQNSSVGGVVSLRVFGINFNAKNAKLKVGNKVLNR